VKADQPKSDSSQEETHEASTPAPEADAPPAVRWSRPPAAPATPRPAAPPVAPRPAPYPAPPQPREATLALPAWLFAFVLLLGAGELLMLTDDSASADDEALPRELMIEDDMVHFMLEGVANGFANITIYLSITNYGEKSSGVLDFEIYAKNKLNDILYDIATHSAPAIDGSKTSEVRIPIRLPLDSSYRIELYLLEDDLRTLSGYGEVSLSDVDQSAVDFTSDDEDSKGGEPSVNAMGGDSDDAAMSPGPGPLLAVAALAGAALLTARRGRGRA